MGLTVDIIGVVREPGRVTVTGEVRRDGRVVPISWPVIIVSDRPGHRTDRAIRETIRQLAEGL